MKKFKLLTLIFSFGFGIGNTQPGGLDPSFGTNGIVKTNTTPDYTDFNSGSAIQSDGKLVVAGSVFDDSTMDFAGMLTRYNTDGSLDNSFNNDGKVQAFYYETNIGHNSVAIQEDGKIVFAGNVLGDGESSKLFNFALARYNIDGSPDSTFGPDGKVTTDMGFFPESMDDINSIAIQKDGKIVAAGRSTEWIAVEGHEYGRIIDVIVRMILMEGWIIHLENMENK